MRQERFARLYRPGLPQGATLIGLWMVACCAGAGCSGAGRGHGGAEASTTPTVEPPTTEPDDEASNAARSSSLATRRSVPTEEPGAIDPALQAVLAMEHRAEKDRARDVFRHPAETLTFFGLKAGSTVVEIWPGRGWYTDILAPYLRPNGRLILATMDPWDPTRRGEMVTKFREHLASRPELYDKVETSILFLPDELTIAESESVDLVVCVRTMHNWLRWEGHRPDPYLQAIARVLKPGGVFGVVQHRGPSTDPKTATGEIGYLSEDRVVELVEQAGLVLEARSEINANPKDGHDHPEGVWSLPPSLKGGDKDRDTFIAIGESDRMTLRFRKPAAL